MALESQTPPSQGLAIILMGVSGVGKSTIGRLLAETLRCQFLDADDYHSEKNIEKMKSGVPLTDLDRFPWLEKLRDMLSTWLDQGKVVVLACSALRPAYRDVLRDADQNRNRSMEQRSKKRVIFVYLKASEFIFSRLEARFKEGQHYMPPSLLKSQIASLEIPAEEDDIITVETSGELEATLDGILEKLKKLQN